MRYRIDEFGFLSGFTVAEDPTTIAEQPPEPVGRFVPRWDGAAWSLCENFRGVTWFNADTLAYEMSTSPDDARQAPWVEVLNGQITSEMPPSPLHVFNYVTKQWVDPRTLDDLKAAKWAEVKKSRTLAEHAGFMWGGSMFDSDALSQQRLTGAVAMAQIVPNFSVEWTLADNTVRTLTGPEMIQVGAALGLHVATQFSKAQALRDRINACVTADEVAAVAWNSQTQQQ